MVLQQKRAMLYLRTYMSTLNINQQCMWLKCEVLLLTSVRCGL